MADKQILILLHGMGKHTAGSFEQEIVEAANNACKRYPSYSHINFADEVDIRSIGYDHMFDKLREEMADSGLSLKDFIKSKLGDQDIPDFIEDLTDIEAGLGGDEFIYTHVLDVIFYLTLLGEAVRLYVVNEILDIKKKASQTAQVNILAHSLGTAVAHDALNKLYTTDASSDTQLNVEQHKLTSLWTIANVSGIITLLSGLESPHDSLVKPGAGGCLVRFNNAFHRFDPFTLKSFKRFDPDNSNNWLTPIIFQYRYKCFKTKKVSRINTHDVKGYLEDPVICHDFLNHFFDFAPDEDEKAAGDAAYKNVQDLAEELIDFITEIDSVADLKAYIKMIKEFLNFAKELDR